MNKKAKIFYFIALGALLIFELLSLLTGLSAQTQPFLFETMAIFIFLPLTIALWTDYRLRIVRPVWLFLLAALTSLFCAMHFYLLILLLA